MFRATKSAALTPKSRPRTRIARRILVVEQLEERSLLSFLPPVNYPVGSYPLGVTVADLRGNGILDLAVADYAVFGGTQGVSVLLGNGDGTFQDARTYDSGGQEPAHVKVVDFNGDGIPDLVVSNYLGSTLSALLGNGDGTFGPPQRFVFTREPLDFQVIGSTKGRPDFAVTNSTLQRVHILRGGKSTFYNTGNTPLSIETADLRGNGSLDLVVANRQSNTVSVLLGNDDGTFQPARNIGVGLHPDTVIVGDFNGDGIPDLATANFDGNNVTIRLGNGDGTFGSAANFSTGSQPISVAAGDFTGNGILDLAVTSANTSSVAILMGNGDGTFQQPLFFPADFGGDTVVVADVDGDRTPDLVVTNYLSNDVSVLLNDGVWKKMPWTALDSGRSLHKARTDLPAPRDPAQAAARVLFAHAAVGFDPFGAHPAGSPNLSVRVATSVKPFSAADISADILDSLGFLVFVGTDLRSP